MSRRDQQLTLFPEPAEGGRRPRTTRSRMFFALWPDERIRAELARAAVLIPPGDAARASWVWTERYHLTLAFLGDIEPRQAEAAERAAAEVHGRPFRLTLDTIGHFEGPNVVWIGPQTLPPELTQLKAELDRELLRYGLPVLSDKFIPHITCLRGVREAPDAPPVRIDWMVSEFVLVRTVVKPGQSRYKVVGRWGLAP
ncbi:MAG: RNA 2',3'-cyclic phosphodiesterase [Nevskia sp.]|nr:RNA 2',3'-cyclic phosphodiesterase [Nevskia sp.]